MEHSLAPERGAGPAAGEYRPPVSMRQSSPSDATLCIKNGALEVLTPAPPRERRLLSAGQVTTSANQHAKDDCHRTLRPISECARDRRTPSVARKPTGLQHRPRVVSAHTISSAAAIDAATMAPTSTGRASYRWRTAARRICAAAVRAAIVGP